MAMKYFNRFNRIITRTVMAGIAFSLISFAV